MSVRRFQMPQWEYKKKHKRRSDRLQRSQRRLQLESLEERRLLAVGPHLAGIQPNDGALLQNGQIRDVAPNELVFRFNSGELIDPATLSGIQVTRSGLDGQFQRADAATDFNTNGTVLLDFVAKSIGESGNGISLEFIRNDLGVGVPPNITVLNEAIFVELNSNSTTPTTAGELRDAINTDGLASALIGASIRVGGSTSAKIGNVDITYSPVVLDGANRASVASNFNAGSRLQIKFRAVQVGPEGNGTRIFVTKTNRGGVSPPVVSVDDGNVFIDLNSNSASPTTAGEVVSAINSHPQARTLVTVELQSGDADTLVGSRNINFSPLRLFGANDVVIEPGFVGLGGSSRDVTFRFKETLPDDLYHVSILGTSNSALRNVDGVAFNDGSDDGIDNGSDFGLDFELDLGARIVSVVPQPLTRNPVTNSLQQARDQIYVYFNNDDLFPTAVNTSVVGNNPTVVDPAFYQLHLTNDTLQNTDDQIIHPTTILYDPAIDLAVLIFADDLENLVGTGSMRLRFGNTEEIPLAPLTTVSLLDQGSSFSTAQPVGASLSVVGTGLTTADGQTLTIEGSATTIFEFEDTDIGDDVTSGNVAIPFDSGMTGAELANAIVNAVNGASLDIQASSDGGSRIALSGAINATVGDGLTSVEVQSLDSLIISASIDPMPFDLAFPGGNDDQGHREVPVENHLLDGADATVGISTVFYNFRLDIGVDQEGEPLFNLITEAQKDRAREIFQLYGDSLGVQFAESNTQGLTIATGDLRALSPTVPTGPSGVLGIAGGGVLILDNAENWDDQFGGTDDPAKFSWFETALHEIGHLLFLGHSTELPPLTIMAGQGIGELLLQFNNPIESVYPGAADLIHGQFLHRPESRDIDMYRVDVPESGLFSAEVFAERQPNSSLLDSVMTLYRAMPDGSRELIARNDDYYSNDSYFELELAAGTYWIGVSASGNDAYNPNVEDSGIGGLTQGDYDLRLNFRPDADRVMRDSTGTALDGDGDGTPGGVFNSWFESQDLANTIFVDKAATGVADGSLAAPFSRISTAFAAAAPGDIVRIVGNGGLDRNPATLADNLAYEIGFNRLGNVLADGATMEVPQDVTVMIDAGAIFKMFRSRIGVGSSSATVDRSGSALQVMGTPSLLDAFGRVVRDSEGEVVPGSVYFTSLHDDMIGQDTNVDAFPPDASPGDWGGISFDLDIDLADANRDDHEARGVFLNQINNADIRYGGGTVVVDGILQIVAPVDISNARPTVTYSSITLSADSAISANPNSFAETNFHALNFQFSPFTSDYQRVGPHVVGNRITDNSINALFVRISTAAAGELQTMTVSGRWDDNDITHVVAENLIVQGTPGGPVQESSPPSVELVTLDAALVLRVTGSGLDISDGETLGLVNALTGTLTTFEFESAGDGVGIGNQTITITPGMSSSVLAMTIASAVNSASIGISATVSDSNITFLGAADRVLSAGLTTILTGAALVAGDYDYRVVFVDADGNEAAPSVATATITLVGSQNIVQLARLPLPSTGFQSRRIYRSSDPAAPVPTYTLVAEINATDTTFTDTGEQIGGELRVDLNDLRPRLDARLAIDPGVVVKLNGATIETRFGGQIIAEGLDGREVIFTSVNDDRFGRGGTFDVTNNTDRAVPTPGDWGGIFFGPSTRGSLDYSQVSYAGGHARIAGNFASFNPVEIQQADVRIAHSLLEQNGDGNGVTATPLRNGRGTNDSATIFVRGAQPIIIENTMTDNAGPVININANALDDSLQTDIGRTTYNRGENVNSPISLLAGYGDNHGPLVRLNRLARNEVNGMEVRGATLTAESVWDDTDIVHVLRNQTVHVADLHTFGGLRLQSSAMESLVVKLVGSNTGLEATGRPLDITDRIGGSLQVIGQPNHPVVLTSINDCTVGAGFTPLGLPMNDTVNSNACVPRPTDVASQVTVQAGGGQKGRPGDWEGVAIDQFANDRNVETITESESSGLAAPGNNATVRDAQHVGALAPHEKAGDENLRLGFEAHGLLAATNDIDIYSFDAAAGTEVWFDIDRTTHALDTVIELIDAGGKVLARSNNSGDETGDPSLLFRSPSLPVNHIQPLRKSAFGEPDTYTTNPQDAGMRVVLPGPANTTNTYYVRIRSSSSDLDQLEGGLTKGAYQLQIRLREADEFPGSTIRYADVRFAINGIQVFGQPSHTPLASEATEALDANGIDTNDTLASAVVLGNVLNTDQAALGIAGEIALPDDVDWFQFDVEYNSVQSIGSTSHSSLILDVDYADGFARPNTNVWVFDDVGNLVAIGGNSNVAEDRPAPLDGSSSADLSRGSAGSLDPFLGPVEFPAVGTAVGRYFVAVAANAVQPAGMEQFSLPLPSNPLVRLEPVNSLNRIAEDHINGTNLSNIANGPQVPVLFDQNSSVEFTLGDVTLYALQDSGVNEERLVVINAFSGAQQNIVGIVGGNVDDITLYSTQGLLYGFSSAEGGNRTDANTGNYFQIDPRRTTTTALGVNLGDDGIETSNEDPMNLGTAVRSNNNDGVGIRFEAIEIGDDPARSAVAGYAIGRRGDAPFAFGVDDQRNLLYEFNPNTGVAISTPGDRSGTAGANPLTQGAWTQIVEHGALDTDNDPIGPGNTVLLASDATTVAPDGSTTFNITDAQGIELPGAVIFTVDDGLGNTVSFEFNAGPEVRYAHSPQTGVTIRDGDTFFLDGLAHEFDTGSVLVVTATGTTIQDGDTFTITDIPPPSPPNAPRPPITHTFEFDRQGGLNDNNNVAIPFTLNDNNLQIISAIVNGINLSSAVQFTVTAIAVGQRISILNENPGGPVTEMAGGPTITVSGAPGVRPGAFTIPVEESHNSSAFGNAIDQAMNGAINASRAGNRINFSGAITSNFQNIVTRGVFMDIGSDGRVLGGFVPVDFLAADTATEVADSMVSAINSNTQVVAVRRGTNVQLQSGAFFAAATEPPLRIGGSAPGGDIKGMAFLNNRLFAVTGDDPSTFGVIEGGGLFEILFPSSNFAFADYVETASDLLTAGSDFFGNAGPVQFTGLTAGPPNAENGRYADMLFGIDTGGRLYAFDTTGALQPVFVDGQTSVETGLFNVDGLAFSNLDYNLWHTTGNRRADPGHGVEQVFDGSRRTEPNGGNLSYYFGYEGPFENGHPFNPKTNPSNSLDYDLIGGAHGSLISNTFSLKDYSRADSPTLYYSYFLDTENTNADLNTSVLMRDSFRVYASGEDGIWHLLSTNNSDRGAGFLDDEFDDPTFFDGIDVPVQESFDIGDQGAPNSWRQVRIPLGDFAGQEDLRLRFDFDSAGGRGPANDFGSGSGAALRQNTVGDEIRALAGSRLRDGQTFTLATLDSFGFGGTQDRFELDFGFTLVAPTGAAISDGASVTIDGVDYIFDSDGFFSRNIQAVRGSLINDGDTFRVGDSTTMQTFEFEDSTNPTGVQPGNIIVSFEPGNTVMQIAAAITDAINGAGLNLTATANGSVVEISNGTFTFAPGNSALQLEDAFAVAFTMSDSASQVGASLANTITLNPPATPTTVGDLVAEPNDTILTAVDTLLTGNPSRFIASGNIGDNIALLDVALDVDFISFEVQVGDVVTIDVDAENIGTTLDAMLLLFDAAGNIVDFSFDDPAPGEQFSQDPFINFTASLTGVYFVGISGEPNSSYDPLLAPTGIAGSTGDYEIEVIVTDAAGLLHRNGERVNLPNAQEVTQQGVPLSFIEGGPGTSSGFAVNVHSGMSRSQVADAISSSLASFFAKGERTAFKTTEEIVHVVGHSFVTQSLGLLGISPLGVSQDLFGDIFGAFEASTALAGQDNVHEGVYIDDIIIGFASRGELVSGDNGGTNFVANGPQPDFEIDLGSYQLEIRRAPEFGISLIPPVPTIFFTDSFDVNDRHVEQSSITAPAGNALSDGQTIVISDGLQELTFEFDDADLPATHVNAGVTPDRIRLGFRPSQSANQVAELIRDTINSPGVQSILSITAALSDGTAAGTTGQGNRINLYGNAIVTTSSAESVGVAGSINDINSAFGSDDLFTFENRSGTGEQITQITITLPEPFFFEPAVGGNQPPTAFSGPDVNPSSDIVGHTFSFRQAVNIDDTIVVDFTSFDPGDRFIFGNDVDFSNNPNDYIGSDYSVTFSGGRVVTGVFISSGTSAGEVAVLDVADTLGIGESVGFGDQNVVRPQGQILIHSNTVTDALEFGISNFAGGRNISNLAPLAGSMPHSGPVRVTREVNPQRLVTGVTIANNVVARNRAGGIRLVGDPNSVGAQLAPLPFGRVYNNTVVGTGAGTGIFVGPNSSPTLLNNIVANFDTGIQLFDQTSTSTVIGGTVYQNNANNTSGFSGLGSFPIDLAGSDPLFVDSDLGNYYLAPGARAIDSSIDSLEDRPALVTVKAPLGFTESPILAPELDSIGQHRVDDPDVDTPPGQGARVFKDRGAIDRADFSGPSAVLLNPQDNDAHGADGNSALTFVELTNTILNNFSIQLVDGVEPSDPQDGTGADDRTVRSDRVTVTSDNVKLRQGLDYAFSYDATNNIIRLTPLAGIWEADRVYEIELSNAEGLALTAPDGASVTDGDSFDVTDKAGNTATFEFESGYSLLVPQTLTLQIPADGGRGIADGEIFRITSEFESETFEFDTNGAFVDGNVVIEYSDQESANDLANKIVAAINDVNLDLSPVNIVNIGGRAVHLGSRSIHSVDTSLTAITETGVIGGIEDGQMFMIDDGTNVLTFEFSTGSSTGVGERIVPFTYAMTHEQIADSIVTTIRNAGLGLNPTHAANSDGLVHVGGQIRHIIDVTDSQLALAGQPGVRPAWGIKIPTVAGKPDFENALADGEVFTVSNGSGNSMTIELDDDGDTIPGNVVVSFNDNTTTNQLANAIAIVIRNGNVDLSPSNIGNGFIRLNGTAAHTLDTTATSLLQIGTAGVPAAVPVDFTPGSTYQPGVGTRNPIFSAENMAGSITVAVNSANQQGLLQDVTATAKDDEVLVDGVFEVNGAETLFRSSIRDFAGNRLQPNRNDGTTKFTIFIGSGLDYGDAPDIYGTTEAANGARHQIQGDFFLGNGVDIDFDGQPSADASGDDQDGNDDEGGIIFSGDTDALGNSILAGGSTATVTVTASLGGLLDAWIDFNADGDWDDLGEQIFSSQPLVAGTQVLPEFNVLGNAAQGQTFARFRLSSAGGLTPTGFADDGEVEDYLVIITANPWRNPSSKFDVTGDGFVTPLDALVLINEINRNGPRQLPIPRPLGNGETSPPLPSVAPYLDVNGDGFITPQGDVSQVITFLNSLANGEGESFGAGVISDRGEGEGSLLAAGFASSAVFVDHRLPAASQEARQTQVREDSDVELIYASDWATSRDPAAPARSPSPLDRVLAEELDDVLADFASRVEYKTGLNDAFFDQA